MTNLNNDGVRDLSCVVIFFVSDRSHSVGGNYTGAVCNLGRGRSWEASHNW